jgi:dTDP-6-deoxy-L-talose 4-dehydrogenase (NAD+)
VNLEGGSVADWFGTRRKMPTSTMLHLAWGGLPNYASADHLERELPAQIAMLEAAIRAGIERVIIVGTCFEYGEASGCIAEDQPLRPTTAYGEAKVRFLDACVDLRTRLGVDIAWLRLFFPFGVGQRRSSLFGQIEEAHASESRSIRLMHPNQVHDFIPVEEVAHTLADVAVSQTPNMLMNVGSGVGRTVQDQAQRMISARAWTVTITPAIEGLREPRTGFWADVRRLRMWQARLARHDS